MNGTGEGEGDVLAVVEGHPFHYPKATGPAAVDPGERGGAWRGVAEPDRTPARLRASPRPDMPAGGWGWR